MVSDAAIYGFGCLIVILSNFTTSLGFLLWRSSGLWEKELPFMKRWRWWLGLVFLVPVLLIFNCLSYALLPQAVISCFSGLSIVFTVSLGHLSTLEWYRERCRCCIKCIDVQEHLALADWVAVASVISGVTLIAVYRGVNEDSDDGVLTMEDSATVIEEPSTIIFASISWFLGLICTVALTLKVHERWGDDSDRVLYMAVGFAFASAMCAAVSVATMQIISAAFYDVVENGWDSIVHWPGSAVWYAVLALCIGVSMQYFLLQATLAIAPVAIGVPAYQSFVVFTGVLADYVIWDATLSEDTMGVDVAIDIIALGLVIAGLCFLCYRQQRRRQAEKDAEQPLAEALSGADECASSKQATAPQESSRLLGDKQHTQQDKAPQ